MQISVRTPTGACYSLSASRSDTVLGLKSRIQAVTGYPAFLQSLFLAHGAKTTLSDSAVLSSVQSGNDLRLEINMGDLSGVHTFHTKFGGAFTVGRNDICLTKEEAESELRKRLAALCAAKKVPLLEGFHLTNGRQSVIYSCEGTVATADVLDTEAGCVQLQGEVVCVCRRGDSVAARSRDICMCNYCGGFFEGERKAQVEKVDAFSNEPQTETGRHI